MSIPLVILAGPTGVGKTGAALEIAEHVQGEIVGADSMQIYRYLNIGTAKPTPEERARISHHLVDIRNPDEEYSAADYARDATDAIRDIHAHGKLPLLVGGTGLYIQAVLYGLFDGPGRDESFRQKMTELAEDEGNFALYQRLQACDPLTAQRLHPNDTMRIVRALEVYHLTGKSISAHQEDETVPLAEFSPCFLALDMPRDMLYARIESRVDRMIADGLVEEVRNLLQQGYNAELHPMKSLGYKEIVAFLAGDGDLDDAVALIKRNTRRYAKRQLTWFRKYAEAHWVRRTAEAPQASVVAQCLCHIEKQAATTGDLSD